LIVPDHSLLESLPVEQRLALAYCPRSIRLAFTALLALDARLAGIVRSSSEPMLGQLRLAWWRDQLVKPMEERRASEPLLAALTAWPGEMRELSDLVDGWEAFFVGSISSAGAIADLAGARAKAIATLDLSANRAHAYRMANNWALADVAAKLNNPDDRSTAADLASAQDWTSVQLPRNLRTLQVLHGLAKRDRGRKELMSDWTALLVASRIGLIGR
jgi:phytoene synthase